MRYSTQGIAPCAVHVLTENIMQLTKAQRSENAEARPAVWELNKAENRKRLQRVPLSAAFLKALPQSSARWIRRISDSARRCKVAM